MNAQVKNYLFLLLLVAVVSSGLKAQASYQLTDAVLTVAGTSSLHDWTMDSKSATGEALITTENSTLKGIEKLQVSLKVETLKSGKSGMDDNAYNALSAKKHPTISFELKEIKSIVQKGNNYRIEAAGQLIIAGQTRTINVQAEAHPAPGALKMIGNKTFKMTDFKIEPPTALMGTIKTGDEITINFALTYTSK